MSQSSSIIGCFVSSVNSYLKSSDEERNKLEKQGIEFRSYIWGEKGLDPFLKKLDRTLYSKEFNLILIQFYVNPIKEHIVKIREIENIRKKEMAIGVSIVINDDLFFNNNEMERKKYLKEIIIKRIEKLNERMKRNNISIDLNKLKEDMEIIIDEWRNRTIASTG